MSLKYNLVQNGLIAFLLIRHLTGDDVVTKHALADEP